MYHNCKQSYTLFAEAQQCFPGGVNSPVRAFTQVGGVPVFLKSAQGAHVLDEDDNLYIDYVGSWGPMIVGHAHPHVLASISGALSHGTSFGACHVHEIALAKMITKLMPQLAMLRFVNSGTEAAMSAIRLARAYTNKAKIIKFAGCYHGHTDSLLVAAGSGGLSCGTPDSAGVLADLAQHTMVAQYNCIDSVAELFKQYPHDIAAVIVEPVAGNMNCVLPEPEFLAQLRDICTANKSLLIFDEVMTGFRVAAGGAQEYYNIIPDLTILGKIIGGGLPVGAFGGSADIMGLLAPNGPVYQAGTLSGNPLAMVAGLATLELVSAPCFYQELNAMREYLASNLMMLAKQYAIPMAVIGLGGMFGVHFTNLESVTNEAAVKQGNLKHFQQFFAGILAGGVYWPPSYFESCFISGMHNKELLDQTLAVAEQVLAQLHT